jgi:hypothetical protein
MHPELVILTGDQGPIPDDDYMGGDFAQAVTDLGKKISGFGIQTPGKTISMGPGGLQVTSTSAAPVKSNGILKNPVALAGIALIAFLLFFKK